MGMNAFVSGAPVLLVISEMPQSKMAALGAKRKHNDYRSMDIGILSAFLCCEATAQGLDTCILGWLNSENIQEICSLNGAVRLVIALGYAKVGDALRPKKRKEMSELVEFLNQNETQS